MKNLVALSLSLTLIGCSSTGYSTFELSEAVISNVEFEETHILKKRKHELEVSFDYSIKNYHVEQGLYHCTVQFLTTDGGSVTSVKGHKSPCALNSEAGSVFINWPTPLDKSMNTPSEFLSKIKYPIEYFVAIHQKTGKHENKIIAKSEVKQSDIKI